jgi:hypothetical protein
VIADARAAASQFCSYANEAKRHNALPLQIAQRASSLRALKPPASKYPLQHSGSRGGLPRKSSVSASNGVDFPTSLKRLTYFWWRMNVVSNNADMVTSRVAAIDETATCISVTG